MCCICCCLYSRLCSCLCGFLPGCLCAHLQVFLGGKKIKKNMDITYYRFNRPRCCLSDRYIVYTWLSYRCYFVCNYDILADAVPFLDSEKLPKVYTGKQLIKGGKNTQNYHKAKTKCDLLCLLKKRLGQSMFTQIIT